MVFLPLVMADSRPVIRPSQPLKKVKDPFNGPPKPFAYQYGVVDADSGSNFDHAQQQNDQGVVTGEICSIRSKY